MKNLLIACLLILIPSILKAQEAGIRVLNAHIIESVNDEKIYGFKQGQTIVVALNDELKNQNRIWWVQALGLNKIYDFNEKGLAFVGVGMDMPEGEYPICLIFRCNDNDRKNELRIKVLKKDFEKTRTASFTGRPKPRQDRQKREIDKAFRENKFPFDLTDALPYIDPSDLKRDVIDPYGLIYRNNPYLPHYGDDLKMPVGTPLKAVNNGKVVLVGKRFRREGNMIIIAHGNAVFSVYLHLKEFGTVDQTEKPVKSRRSPKKRSLKVGDMVEQGQVIGLSGKTGRGVREPHLHFNVKIDDVYVDPLSFIDTVNKFLK